VSAPGTADLGVGVIGVGTMGADHAERLARRIAGARLVAVSDPDTARAGELATAYGVRSIEDPLALVADEAVDAVLIASPGVVHEPQLMACLDHGKAVLCEKPLTMDSGSSLRVVEAERATGQQLVTVGFMRRFDPEYVRMKEVMDEGSLGAPLVVHQVHRNKDVPPTFTSEMVVRDSLVHEVDVARFLLGEEIASLQVLTPRATSAGNPGIADPQVALFTMASGVVVTNEVFVQSHVGYEVRCEVVAERGTVIAGRPWAELYLTSADAASWGGPVPADYRTRFARAYDLEVQAWVDAARRGEVVGATAYDGYVSTVVCTAGMESLRTGQPVEVTLAQDP